MEPIPSAGSGSATCPQCHVVVKSLPTSLATEIMYYAGSVLLPPLGFWWGIKYLKQSDAASKRIGIVSMILTVISFILTSIWVVDYVNKLNAMVGSQLNGLQGF
jgi:uncharacterized membrane protein